MTQKSQNDSQIQTITAKFKNCLKIVDFPWWANGPNGPYSPYSASCSASQTIRCVADYPFLRFLDLWVIFGFLGHPEIGTAITKCFEHLDDEKHILDPGQLYP